MNNLIILFRSLSAASLGCYGSNARTPTFDEVAASGDLFTHCYSDLSGDSIKKFIETIPTQQVNNLESEIDFSQAVTFSESNQQTLVIQVNTDIESEQVDQFLNTFIEQARQFCDTTFNVLITALNGGSFLANSSNEADSPNEMTAHVPLIVSVADQKTSRRRSELLTSENVVENIVSLLNSKEKYQSHRDSLSTDQITYRTDSVTATRTQHWLHFRSDESDEHGESSQQLFRKPEDLWEILDVADQYPQVIEHFEATGQLSFPDSV